MSQCKNTLRSIAHPIQQQPLTTPCVFMLPVSSADRFLWFLSSNLWSWWWCEVIQDLRPCWGFIVPSNILKKSPTLILALLPLPEFSSLTTKGPVESGKSNLAWPLHSATAATSVGIPTDVLPASPFQWNTELIRCMSNWWKGRNDFHFCRRESISQILTKRLFSACFDIQWFCFQKIPFLILQRIPIMVTINAVANAPTVWLEMCQQHGVSLWQKKKKKRWNFLILISLFGCFSWHF